MKNEKIGLSPTLQPKYTKILILGTFPSEQSIKSGQYYSNKRNRFWKTIFLVIEEEMPLRYEDKLKVLKKHGICLWDLLEECERTGSLDKNIKNIKKNDLSNFKNAKIFVNSFTVKKQHKRFGLTKNDLNILTFLPSTSSMNANYNTKELAEEWKNNIYKETQS